DLSVKNPNGGEEVKHRSPQDIMDEMAALDTESAEVLGNSKYPPAEPEALRLLAPQRGLIATGEKQNQLQRHEDREATGFGNDEGNSARYTPGILKV
ncbi:MAG TPA: hypothetical protein VII29_06060, partial [Terriglobales bacterium]